MFYFFYRRYGWDDMLTKNDKVQVFTPSITQRTRTISKDEELKFKDRIVAVSTSLIAWFEQQQLRQLSLKIMCSAIRIAKCAQTTRYNLVVYSIRWLSTKLDSSTSNVQRSDKRMSLSLGPKNVGVNVSPFLPPDATPETMYMAVKDLVLLCMTDSSYSVRTAAIPLISRLLSQLSLSTIQKLLDHIIDMFNRQEVQMWETAEGLLNTLGLLVKRAVPTACDSDGTTYTIVGVGTSTICMSPETYENQFLPKLKTLVYTLFDNKHPSVRIGAVHLFITCLKRCPHQAIEKALDEIMNEICLSPDPDSEDVRPPLSAAATESLLSVCQVLLQHAGGVRLPASTGELQNNLIKFFIGHADPNVRMVACQVYETLIVSALDNLNRVRYLLSKIMENWSVKQEILLTPLQKNLTLTNGPKATGQSNPTTFNPGGMTHWREGRLYIFERVCHILVQRHFAVLYEVLVRGVDSDATPTMEDINPFDAIRLQHNLSNASKGHLTPSGREMNNSVDHRGSISLEDNISNISRAGSGPLSPFELSLVARSRGSTSRIGSYATKKNTPSVLSILDRFRLSDEAEKHKQDATRSSVWKNELVRRISMASWKVSASKSSVTSVSEPGTSRLRMILSSLLNVSCENLVAEPRELRQCARRAFPELTRLIRWYDADLTLELLTTYIVFQPNLMTYACLKILRSSLDELVQYDLLVICGQGLESANPTSQPTTPDWRMKSTQIVDIFPDGYFLNVALLRHLFNGERSTWWLRMCQHYVTDELVPTFVAIPAFDCILMALRLAHLLSQITQTARYTESIRPPLIEHGNRTEPVNLEMDANALAEAVRAAVSYVRRFQIVLDEKFRASTPTADHLKIGPLRPFTPVRSADEKNSKGIARITHGRLAPFLSRLITSMESILFQYIPPSPNPTKPDPIVRRAAGQLLSPLLSHLVTWPMALLPPTWIDGSMNSRRESRILALRKLLRVIAAVVHALPCGDQMTPHATATSSKRYSLPVQLDELTRGRTDLTSIVNGYFTQLEKILLQLSEVYKAHGSLCCQSGSWWWFRALCEHMPRLVQVAPHANPVSLIRCLLDETGRNSKQSSLSSARQQDTHVKKTNQLWSKAFLYAKKEVAKGSTSQKETQSFAYRWPTVGEILNVVADPKQTTDNSSPERTSSDEKRDIAPDENYETSQFLTARNPAFDYMTEDEEDLDLEFSVPDSSSGEEVMMTLDNPVRKQASVVRSPRRTRINSSSQIKAQVIETPPPYPDVVSLVKRVWNYCEPVTVRTLENLLSASELSLITGEKKQSQ
ncbi:hypothetical protein PHET_01409 [Paragonimus heterotremus]|uniref:Uncharacterized protein n=1 Tax=Paragonimus heterotremus TaxID=100268 RepID=A0A8J4WUN8_9TREM|nr:hypothetical protein PHET_01409 [Paragonimus heterotremus]